MLEVQLPAKVGARLPPEPRALENELKLSRGTHSVHTDVFFSSSGNLCSIYKVQSSKYLLVERAVLFSTPSTWHSS